MKLKFDKNTLLKAVQKVIKATPQHTTKPILECIRLTTENGKIRLFATDMELAIETIVEGEVEETGAIALDAKMFLSIVSKMPDGVVEVITKDNLHADIKAGKVKFAIAGRDADGFPHRPEFEGDKEITVSQYSLKEIIAKTIFSVGADTSTNKVMSGMLFYVDGDKMSVTSLDGFRISVRHIDLRESFETVSAIIPGKTLSEINKIIAGDADKDVAIAFSDKEISFNFDSTSITSRLIEGKYFDVSNFMNIQHQISLSVNRQDFLECIDRASLLVKEGDKKPIVMQTSGDSIEMKITSTLGSMDETIQCKKTGGDITIGLNPRYMIDSLRAIDEDEISLYLTSSKQPVIIRDRSSYLYCILPVNVA